jgi:hypothetical protein
MVKSLHHSPYPAGAGKRQSRPLVFSTRNLEELQGHKLPLRDELYQLVKFD